MTHCARPHGRIDCPKPDGGRSAQLNKMIVLGAEVTNFEYYPRLFAVPSALRHGFRVLAASFPLPGTLPLCQQSSLQPIGIGQGEEREVAAGILSPSPVTHLGVSP